MFKRLDEDAGAMVPVMLDGEPVMMEEGDLLASQLILLGKTPLRLNPVDLTPRAPHCMIGQCFECLVEIDGIANRQSCMTRVRAGMTVRRQLAPPAEEPPKPWMNWEPPRD